MAPMTHVERRKRRKRVATLGARGSTVSSLMNRFGYSRQWVRCIFRSEGVPLPKSAPQRKVGMTKLEAINRARATAEPAPCPGYRTDIPL